MIRRPTTTLAPGPWDITTPEGWPMVSGLEARVIPEDDRNNEVIVLGTRHYTRELLTISDDGRTITGHGDWIATLSDRPFPPTRVARTRGKRR